MANVGTAVLLGAGYSTRFGSDKRLTKLVETPLIIATVNQYLQKFERVCVVIRPEDEEIQALLPSTVSVVLSERADQGISQSIVSAVQANLNSPWLLFGLADMPFVLTETLGLVEATLNTTDCDIVRLKSDGKFGNPVGFRPSCYSKLKELVGDTGARTLFQSSNFQTEILCVKDPGIHIDIDTLTQLKEYKNLEPRSSLVTLDSESV